MFWKRVTEYALVWPAALGKRYAFGSHDTLPRPNRHLFGSFVGFVVGSKYLRSLRPIRVHRWVRIHFLLASTTRCMYTCTTATRIATFGLDDKHSKLRRWPTMASRNASNRSDVFISNSSASTVRRGAMCVSRRPTLRRAAVQPMCRSERVSTRITDAAAATATLATTTPLSPKVTVVRTNVHSRPRA